MYKRRTLATMKNLIVSTWFVYRIWRQNYCHNNTNISTPILMERINHSVNIDCVHCNMTYGLLCQGPYAFIFIEKLFWFLIQKKLIFIVLKKFRRTFYLQFLKSFWIYFPTARIETEYSMNFFQDQELFLFFGVNKNEKSCIFITYCTLA